ncbi:MAG: hypothetical protein QXG01_04740 [Candidatus Bathyarchaeia archaeon]
MNGRKALILELKKVAKRYEMASINFSKLNIYPLKDRCLTKLKEVNENLKLLTGWFGWLFYLILKDTLLGYLKSEAKKSLKIVRISFKALKIVNRRFDKPIDYENIYKSLSQKVVQK